MLVKGSLGFELSETGLADNLSRPGLLWLKELAVWKRLLDLTLWAAGTLELEPEVTKRMDCLTLRQSGHLLTDYSAAQSVGL